jgi:hypothetical protein
MNPSDILAEALIFGASGLIERQEEHGQRSFVGSDTLPTNISCGGSCSAKVILEAAGVKFLGPVEGDNLFQYVELPHGWEKVATDHSMWSKLVDDKGRERASIFYKAAFYDRDAHVSLCCRFGMMFDYNRFSEEGVGVTNITDGGKVIHTTDPIPANSKKNYEAHDESDKAAIEWLDKNHPDWRNPGAYWE